MRLLPCTTRSQASISRWPLSKIFTLLVYLNSSRKILKIKTPKPWKFSFVSMKSINKSSFSFSFRISSLIHLIICSKLLWKNTSINPCLGSLSLRLFSPLLPFSISKMNFLISSMEPLCVRFLLSQKTQDLYCFWLMYFWPSCKIVLYFLDSSSSWKSAKK